MTTGRHGRQRWLLRSVTLSAETRSLLKRSCSGASSAAGRAGSPKASGRPRVVPPKHRRVPAKHGRVSRKHGDVSSGHGDVSGKHGHVFAKHSDVFVKRGGVS